MNESELQPYLMLNANALNYLEQCLSKATTVVCIVESCEANDGMPQLPHLRAYLFDPVGGHSEVCVYGSGLPGITC